MSVTRRKYVDMTDMANDAARLLITEAAAAIEGKAASLAPVDTANLRNSIRRDVQSPTYAEVVADAEYAVYQEFGTRYQDGTPYMRPAVDEYRSQLARKWKDATKDAYGRNKR